MSIRNMPIVRLSQREAFFHGFFSVFGLTKFSVKLPHRSELDALQDDFSVISEDGARVFSRETSTYEKSSEPSIEDEQK